VEPVRLRISGRHLAETPVTATGLPAGNYVVQVTDANQCLTSVPVVISEPAVLGIVANTTANIM